MRHVLSDWDLDHGPPPRAEVLRWHRGGCSAGCRPTRLMRRLVAPLARTRADAARRAIPDDLWRLTLARLPFLERARPTTCSALRELSTLFLADKEFIGARGLQVDDAMAVAIAAQACLPVLQPGPGLVRRLRGHRRACRCGAWPAASMRRDGVVHEYDEELAGEAMEGGPVMLSWRDVADAGESADWGYNVVIHEFAHVLDMRDGVADGVPPLPDRAAARVAAVADRREYRALLRMRWTPATRPLLDPYGAEAPDEFFAVAAKLSSSRRSTCAPEHPALYELLAASTGRTRRGCTELDGA